MAKNTFKITIAYDGTNFSGWQKQKNAPTIQECIESTLSKILDNPTILHGAGRTDAGVHALGMVAHFQTEKNHTPDTYLKALNSILPESIRVIDCNKVTNDFHARFSATGKHYCYHIFNGKIQLPTQRLYSTHIPYTLDLSSMRKCLEMLIGTHDFSTFEATGSRDIKKNTGRGAVRTISSATLDYHENSIRIDITGNGFLRHMVRNIVGTVIEVGLQTRTVDEFTTAFSSKNRSNAGPTALAKGLFLSEVYY